MSYYRRAWLIHLNIQTIVNTAHDWKIITIMKWLLFTWIKFEVLFFQFVVSQNLFFFSCGNSERNGLWRTEFRYNTTGTSRVLKSFPNCEFIYLNYFNVLARNIWFWLRLPSHAITWLKYLFSLSCTFSIPYFSYLIIQNVQMAKQRILT